MDYKEFLSTFLPEFQKIRSFAGRLNYAKQYLQGIGSGSGRQVFDIDGEKVLKVAKNPKGVAQNAEEAGIGRFPDAQDVVTEVFDWGENETWVIAEKGKKVTEKRIKQLTGIPSLNDLYYYVRNYDSENKGRGKIFGQKPEVIEFLNENQFTQDLTNFISNYGQQPGDYGRPSSYGEVNRSGQPTIVLTDYGLSDEVYSTHYDRSSKRYGMYEMYNFQDGNDDMLSDIGNTGEVRHAMWALQPYSVSDGDGVINEDFISFISNRDKYPSEGIIPSTPHILDEFHDIVNNLSEVLKHVSDKKKFYNNLLELQDYLIRGKFYDREPLQKEEHELNEDGSLEVEPMSLDKTVSDGIANEVASKLNLGTAQHLGEGGNGFAYLISGNKVLKITTDACEVDAGGKIMRSNPQRLVNVFGIYKVIDTDRNVAVYVLIEDFIADKPKQEFVRYSNIIAALQIDYVGMYIMLQKKKFDEFYQQCELIKTTMPDANITAEDREKAYQFMIDISEIKKELMALAIKSNDYSNLDNLGNKNSVLTFFDIGGCRVEPPQFPEQNIINLPEDDEHGDVLDEGVKRNSSDRIAAKVAEMYHLNPPEYLAEGTNGVAYDIGDDKVLKVTSDRSEAVENLELLGKPLKYIAEPYKVFSITPKEGEQELFVIILEKLKTDAEYFNRMKKRLDYVLDKIMGVALGDVFDHFIRGDPAGVDEEKLNKYFIKNPEDKKYFDGLMNIAEEAKLYCIESMDYLNPNNLGYKKNGVMGFFDVGFGNPYSNSAVKPIEVQMDEDGSALYSTENSLGQDNFPPHDNVDTSPMISNDLQANSAMYNEDLEYNHVSGDATQDEYQLTERDKSFAPNSQGVEVKQKCRLAGNGNTSTACNQGDINNLNLTPVSEEIDAKQAHRDEDAMQAMVDGLKDVALISFKLNPELRDIADENNFRYIKVDQKGIDVDNYIVYRQTAKGNANAMRLYSIMKSKGGYCKADTPEEAQEIGKLFDYSDESIQNYINKNFANTNKNSSFASMNEVELINLNINEARNLMKMI